MSERDIGRRLLALANGIKNPLERQFIYQQVMTELERRAAPKPGTLGHAVRVASRKDPVLARALKKAGL